ADLRQQRAADLHQMLLADLVYLPLVYNTDIFVYRKGIVGPRVYQGLGRNSTINVHEWTMD
ncbi:MAG: hypothetical protein QOF51_3596, partial [Chloroflexota bacterium]|nr:hypothetical protein [Chloroflexota bacterium]